MIRNAIVILNWNGREYLEKFLPALLHSVGRSPDEVIIADNASTDGSLELLEQKFPEVRTIVFDKNYGFTGGYDRAFEQIEAENYVLINSDIEVTPDWLVPLQEWMDYHNDCGICSPKILSWYERDRFEYAGAAGGYLDRYGFPFCRGRIMKMTEKDEGQYDTPVEVQWTSGACLMIRAELWHQLGGLDERFFAHMEEIDLCWRAKLAGYKVNVVPRSVVYHIGGGTLPNESEFKLFLNYRNNLMLLKNNLAKTLALETFFNLAAEMEPVEAYCSDPFFAAISVFKGEDLAMKQVWIVNSVKMAELSTEAIIFKRKVIDWCAACAYLLQGKLKYARAVRRAHREYKDLQDKGRPQQDTMTWLTTCIDDPRFRTAKIMLGFDDDCVNMGKSRFKLKGIYSRFIVWQAVFHKKTIFETVRERLK